MDGSKDCGLMPLNGMTTNNDSPGTSKDYANAKVAGRVLSSEHSMSVQQPILENPMDAKQKYDTKQARRKQNRGLRKHGLEQLTATSSRMVHESQIGKLQKRAEHDIRLRCKLGHDTQHASTPNERAAAAKAKAKLNDVWINRVSRNLTGFWNPGA